jgi:hypothetical protein
VQVAGKGTAASSSYLAISAARVDSFSPKLAAAGGMTLLTLTGKGYDGSACNMNSVEVDGVACPVLSCSAGTLSVLFPGGWWADRWQPGDSVLRAGGSTRRLSVAWQASQRRLLCEGTDCTACRRELRCYMRVQVAAHGMQRLSCAAAH